jgi:hypothetical protein
MKNDRKGLHQISFSIKQTLKPISKKFSTSIFLLKKILHINIFTEAKLARNNWGRIL